MVKTIKLRDSTFPGQRLEKLKYGPNYRNDPATTDVTLHCGATGKSIKAHSLVLASISDVLRDYLFEYEKEGNVCSCFNPMKKKGKENVSDKSSSTKDSTAVEKQNKPQEVKNFYESQTDTTNSKLNQLKSLSSSLKPNLFKSIGVQVGSGKG